MEDAAGVVSVPESAEAGPGKPAALPPPQDPDASGHCSLGRQGFIQVQSMTPGREVKGQFPTTLPGYPSFLHAPFRPRYKLASC